LTDSINLAGLLSRLREHPQFEHLAHELDTPHDGEWRWPVLRAARPFVLAAAAQQLHRSILIVAARPDRAQALHDSLRAYGLTTDRLARFSEPSALFYERAPWPREVATERLQVLAKLTADDGSRAAARQPSSMVDSPSSPIIVASTRALMFRTLPPRAFKLGTRTLKRAQSVNIDQLLESLVGFGYDSTSTVLAPGEFSRRGGIVDVFPPALTRPVRIEFFGDEIDSLRSFDPATQRSLDTLDQVTGCRMSGQKRTGGRRENQSVGHFTTARRSRRAI
jgi:transcription-repair coupling factor (superfamily II helicase)